ncbi:MAG: SIS domain-containing protein [Microthrixaceae bacterium]
MTGPLDSLRVRERVLGLGEVVRHSARAADPSTLEGLSPATVVIATTPFTRLAGEILLASTASDATIPVVGWHHDTPPPWADTSTLVVALDDRVAERWHHSGLAAPMIAPEAVDAELRAVATTSFVAAVLAALGGVPAVTPIDMEEVASHLETLAVALPVSGTGVPDPARLARRIGRTMVLAYGAGASGGVVADVWKSAINRSAKAPAFANSLPDLLADELCGWGQHGDVTRQVFTWLDLRHGFETVAELDQLGRMPDFVEEVVADRLAVEVSAPSPVAAMLSHVMVAELTAVEMAAIAGVDPGPTPAARTFG